MKLVVASQVVMPASDDNLNIYLLPIGEGDSTIIQCPTGKLTVLNMGSMYTSSYFNENDIEKFINIEKVENIIISRPHPSVYNLLPIVFKDISAIKKVYITCDINQYAVGALMRDWMAKLNRERKVFEIRANSTRNIACLGSQCPTLNLCTDTPFFDSKILAAGLGGCSGRDEEMKSDSLVLQIKFYDFSMIFPGDLQDPSKENNKFSKQVIASVSDPEDLQATVYKASNHGNWERTNKYFFINALKPQYLVINNAVPRKNSTNQYTPSCELLHYLSQREGGSLLSLATTQSFQCMWEDGSTGRLDETHRAIFLTAYDSDDYKVRRVLQISSDGENHKVTHMLAQLG